ncbi:acyl carrier protein [Streptomyces sp. NPDC058045]|uniref:acyl carrier protein n=1 Tax=Streptomyces sp. NPDC058045 TaxID=3346311 RepID=UPI0036DFBA00
MKHNDIVTVVRDVVARILIMPSEQVSPSALFYEDLGGDSLQKLEVIASVEARFDCRLTNEEAATSNSVEDLARHVAQHVA